MCFQMVSWWLTPYSHSVKKKWGGIKGKRCNETRSEQTGDSKTKILKDTHTKGFPFRNNPLSNEVLGNTDWVEAECDISLRGWALHSTDLSSNPRSGTWAGCFSFLCLHFLSYLTVESAHLTGAPLRITQKIEFVKVFSTQCDTWKGSINNS